MDRRSREPGDARPDEHRAMPGLEDEGRPEGGERPAGAGKAEPEKAETEIEAGDIADELADFA